MSKLIYLAHREALEEREKDRTNLAQEGPSLSL